MPKVMIHPATYERLDQAVDRAFDLFPLDLRSKRVFIKPNVLRASQAGEGIVTHPAVLRAVVEKVEAMGPASIVVGDNPGVMGYGANEECFRKTGLMEAAKGYYQNIGNDSQDVDFNPNFMPRVGLSRIVLEADIIISLPKFKTHGLTVVTGQSKTVTVFCLALRRLGCIGRRPARNASMRCWSMSSGSGCPICSLWMLSSAWKATGRFHPTSETLV